MYSSIHFTHFKSFIIRFFTSLHTNVPTFNTNNSNIMFYTLSQFCSQIKYHLEVTTEAVPVVPHEHPVVVVVADDDGDGVRPDRIAAHASQPIAHGVTSIVRPNVGQVALAKLENKLKNINNKKAGHSIILMISMTIHLIPLPSNDVRVTLSITPSLL